MLSKIISGGQTGVDRAALDAALALGFAVGGWCPKGRKAEDGVIAVDYPLCETPSAEYAERTLWNIRDSDGSLIICQGLPMGGTLLTLELAQKLAKPFYLFKPNIEQYLNNLNEWLEKQSIKSLNIAGPRESQQPGIYCIAYELIYRLLKQRL